MTLYNPSDNLAMPAESGTTSGDFLSDEEMRGEFAFGYGLEDFSEFSDPPGYNLNRRDTQMLQRRGDDEKNHLNFEVWNCHVEIQEIAEGLEYNRDGSQDQFWQKHSTKTGLKRTIASLDKLERIRDAIDSQMAMQQWRSIREHAYELIEYRLSGILNQNYESWPEESASFEEWPASETIDFIRNISEDDIEYKAYERIRNYHLEQGDDLPNSELPAIEDIIPDR